MDKLAAFLVNLMMALVISLWRAIIGYWLLDGVFSLGFLVWWAIAVFLGMFVPTLTRD